LKTLRISIKKEGKAIQIGPRVMEWGREWWDKTWMWVISDHLRSVPCQRPWPQDYLSWTAFRLLLFISAGQVSEACLRRLQTISFAENIMALH
jgi:hypothetical protein